MLSALLGACQESTNVNTKRHLCLSQLSSTSFSQGGEPHGSFLDFWMAPCSFEALDGGASHTPSESTGHPQGLAGLVVLGADSWKENAEKELVSVCS